MTDYSKISFKIKQQIALFCNKITDGLFKKPLRRAIKEIIFGIQAQKDIKLSSIARSLGEKIPLIKVENRLSNNLKKADFSSKIIERLLQNARNYISRDTVIAIDGGDISKKYANKMENIAFIRDGSTGEIKKGYSLLHVAAADVKGENMIPLFMSLYSSEAENFISENKQIINAIDLIRSYIGNNGIWTIDRGGDRKILIKKLCYDNLRFVIRIKENRKFLVNKENDKDEYEKRSIIYIQNKLSYIKHNFSVKKEGLSAKSLKIGYCKVRIAGIDNVDMHIVVIKRLASKPMILLTNLNVGYENNCYKPKEILEIYLTRWKCDENYRFLKKSYNLEDIRVNKYISLQNMIALVLAVFYFLCVFIGLKTKLNILLKQICDKSQRFFQIPSYICYAIADGIFKILSKIKEEAFAKPSKPPPYNQLKLFPEEYYLF